MKTKQNFFENKRKSHTHWIQKNKYKNKSIASLRHEVTVVVVVLLVDDQQVVLAHV
jgi:hypothetical protein